MYKVICGKFDKINQKEEAIQLFDNMTTTFNKMFQEISLSDFNKNIKSQIVEMNDDYYASVDVNAFVCLPTATPTSINPIQYFLSFNPPLTIRNSTLYPLIVSEIDNYGTQQEQSKETAKIAPSKQTNLISLDISSDNQSQIQLQFRDNDHNRYITQNF